MIAAHQHALETLSHSQTATKAELDQKHIDAVATLPTALATDAQFATDLNGLSGKPLLDAIIHEKAHINYLISQRSDLSNQKRQTAYAFANQDPLEITGEQYKAILGSRSVNAEQAHQVHRAWTQAYKDALEANLHIRASEHLGHLSDTLTNRYAEQSNSLDRESERAALKHLAEANRFGRSLPDLLHLVTNCLLLGKKRKLSQKSYSPSKPPSYWVERCLIWLCCIRLR